VKNKQESQSSDFINYCGRIRRIQAPVPDQGSPARLPAGAARAGDAAGISGRREKNAKMPDRRRIFRKSATDNLIVSANISITSKNR
jgi:hypothetical protein